MEEEEEEEEGALRLTRHVLHCWAAKGREGGVEHMIIIFILKMKITLHLAVFWPFSIVLFAIQINTLWTIVESMSIEITVRH